MLRQSGDQKIRKKIKHYRVLENSVGGGQGEIYNGQRRQCHVNDLSKRIFKGVRFVVISLAGLE